MKDVGDTGKYNATPPSDYCPPVEKSRFVLENYSVKNAKTISPMKQQCNHIKSVCKNEIQKMFVSDARDYIEANENHHKWMNDFTDVSTDDDLIDQLEKANRFPIIPLSPLSIVAHHCYRSSW